jgi:ABC-type lipoprotein export system ATPase subunit
MAEPFIDARGLFKIFKSRDIEIVALQGLDFRARAGEVVAIVGASGSGKSTFLNMLGGLDLPSAGSLRVDGKDLAAMPEAELVRYRRSQVGFLWQQPSRNLLPYLTARQNVELPMVLAGVPKRAARAAALLDAVGMAPRADNLPAALSGGEMQRVAIAIALALDPPLLLADEPTGELDRATADGIIALFRRLAAERKVTVVLVTHDPEVAAQVDRVARIRDGRVATETIAAAGRLAQERVVVDPAGRLQLPAALLERYGIRGAARVAAAGDHIGIFPPQEER